LTGPITSAAEKQLEKMKQQIAHAKKPDLKTEAPAAELPYKPNRATSGTVIEDIAQWIVRTK
jgi:hypothetical protein